MKYFDKFPTNYEFYMNNLRAVRVNEDFEIATIEGCKTGKPGDFIIEDESGAMSICSKTKCPRCEKLTNNIEKLWHLICEECRAIKWNRNVYV